MPGNLATICHAFHISQLKYKFWRKQSHHFDYENTVHGCSSMENK